MKTLNLAIATVATLSIIGCGGGGSTTPTQTTDNTSGNTTNGSTIENNTSTSMNALEANNIKERLSYVWSASDLVSGSTKKECHKMDTGHSYTIKWQIASAINEMDVYYNEYSNVNCVGEIPDVRFGSAKYRITTGNVINNGKALEVDFQFVSGDDWIADMPGHILGYDIGKTYYTIAVSSGTYQNQNLIWSVAKPTDANDGTSPSKRASDVSNYTSGKYYFAQ